MTQPEQLSSIYRRVRQKDIPAFVCDPENPPYEKGWNEATNFVRQLAARISPIDVLEDQAAFCSLLQQTIELLLVKEGNQAAIALLKDAMELLTPAHASSAVEAPPEFVYECLGCQCLYQCVISQCDCMSHGKFVYKKRLVIDIPTYGAIKMGND